MFLAAWFASAPLVNFLDHTLKSHLYGGLADGTATLLAMLLGVVPGGLVAMPVERTWWATGLIGASCSPITIVVMYCLWR